MAWSADEWVFQQLRGAGLACFRLPIVVVRADDVAAISPGRVRCSAAAALQQMEL
ncbi:hypothetical protein [Streptomyces sp. NBC_00829]|uniref:hypothetical protein n=1 Tax=Streptomyces sp. NBC_00829 TaxID=2903679 RepID=UPI00386BFAD9|nr:hypothetical protein OG293_17475 [Streptomyces sp. NBC_00829]